jgi:hypothetical protein
MRRQRNRLLAATTWLACRRHRACAIPVPKGVLCLELLLEIGERHRRVIAFLQKSQGCVKQDDRLCELVDPEIDMTNGISAMAEARERNR